MIPISSMRRQSRYQIACDRGFNPRRVVEERIEQYEQGARANKLELLRQINQALESLHSLFAELQGYVESDQADREISCLEREVIHLKGLKTHGREELAKAIKVFDEILFQNRALRAKIESMKQTVKNKPEDPLCSFAREAGNRGNHYFAGRDPAPRSYGRRGP